MCECELIPELIFFFGTLFYYTIIPLFIWLVKLIKRKKLKSFLEKARLNVKPDLLRTRFKKKARPFLQYLIFNFSILPLVLLILGL